MKGGYIRENIRTVYDIISYLQTHNKTGILLLIDFEKAFDSVEWDYINKVLRTYNLGDSFIKWYNLLFQNSSSCVIYNGNISEFFNLGRACRQGDPLSPYLLILAIEPLAMAIKNNEKIIGIQINNRMIKNGQYAVDTFLLLDNSDQSLRESLNLLHSFHECSDLKINVEKTQAVKLGVKDAENTEIRNDLGLVWTDTFILLGINLSTNLNKMISPNY